MTNPYLPPEILDHIIDLLHDEQETLEQCCLASKSWVPRTRKYLFANIRFRSASDLESWKKTFPDVTNSPAYQTHTLFVGCPRLIVAADGGEGGWIRAFSGVKSLDVDNGHQQFIASEVSLTPFCRFSPSLKSLRVAAIVLPHPGLFDLILSFPLLEDLTLMGYDELGPNDDDPHRSQTIIPSTLPMFTGSLEFHVFEGVGTTARRLLDLPDGLHFRKLTLFWDHVEDLRWIKELVSKCSHTLESLDVTYTPRPVLESVSFDLSRATKLRDMVFRPESQSVKWVVMALQTITAEHRDLQQISIHLPSYLTFANIGADIRKMLGEVVSQLWFDLDHLLVQFWELRSIRPKVGRAGPVEEGQNIEYCLECLLPEITRRGIVDPV